MNIVYITGTLVIVLALVVMGSVKCFGLLSVKNFFASNSCKTLIALVAAVVMYFTPDNIDYCIITFLSFLGIPPLVIDFYKKG